MQLTISNKGKAIIYLSKARAYFDKRTVELANCKTCDQEIKKSFQEGSLFFTKLIEELMSQ